MDSLLKKLQAVKDEHWSTRGEFNEAVKEKYDKVLNDLKEMKKYFDALEIERYPFSIHIETGAKKEDAEFYYAVMAGKIMVVDEETRQPVTLFVANAKQAVFFTKNVVDKWDKIKPAIVSDLETKLEDFIDQLEEETRQMRMEASMGRGEVEELPGDVIR